MSTDAPATDERFRPLATKDDWAAAQEASHDQPVVIFKHSSICPTSAKANEQMMEVAADAPVYRVVVQDSRAVSDTIAEDTGIRHESPQVLILDTGTAVFDASHHRVKADAVRDELASAGSA